MIRYTKGVSSHQRRLDMPLVILWALYLHRSRSFSFQNEVKLGDFWLL